MIFKPCQIDNLLYKRYVLKYVARSELSGQFVTILVSKERGDFIVPVHFIQQMSSDLNI